VPAGLPLIIPITAVPDPVEIFQKLGGPDRAYSFLLHSALAGNRLGRYSWIGIEPFLVLEAKERQVKITYADGIIKTFTANPLDTLKEILAGYHLPATGVPLPFWGGAVGYFSYDLGRRLEVIPAIADDDLKLPDLFLGFYDTIVAIDHLTGKVYICSTGLPYKGYGGFKQAQQKVSEISAILKQDSHFSFNPTDQDPTSRSYRPDSCGTAGARQHVQRHFTKESYCRAVEQTKEYIAAGDIFQVNLSQRFSAPFSDSPWALYRCLTRLNPAPFAAYLQFPSLNVASASPERFLKVTGRQVETRPIKGTRPRGKNPASDHSLRQELWNSAKDRAELTMVIDLERNDLGRVCETGSVRVPELFRLEEYATVFHLVSTITGTLAPGKGTVDLLRAAFPGGSITGAPKIRAMEIIEELEPVRRSIYTGSIGWIGFHGDADLNIVIRTFIVKDSRVYFQAGGAVTADSVPEAEYKETLDKAAALFKALHYVGRPGLIFT